MANPPLAHPWQALFAGATFADEARLESYFVLRKNQHPWLLLPAAAQLAHQALELYPAQTAKARLARTLLAVAFQCGWYPGAERIELPRMAYAPWERFLAKLAQGNRPPAVASLAGNPASEGQRLVLLVFNATGRPQAVVKVGLGGRAARLILAEVNALKSLPAGLRGVPLVRGEFSHDQVQAFAMDYCRGSAPGATDDQQLPVLMHAWIRPGGEIPFLELPAVRALVAAVAQDPGFAKWQQSVAGLDVHPVVMQGDFAPWNIKVTPATRDWTVLDWERGDLNGVPGWDWFHYVIQPEILVKRRPVAAIAARIRGLLSSAAFQVYANATGIGSHTQAVLFAYLAHAVTVIQPSEGLAVTRQLMEEFRP
jgi:hypothetical protein